MAEDYDKIAKETARSRTEPIWPNLDQDENDVMIIPSEDENEEDENPRKESKDITIFEVIESEDESQKKTGIDKHPYNG